MALAAAIAVGTLLWPHGGERPALPTAPAAASAAAPAPAPQEAVAGSDAANVAAAPAPGSQLELPDGTFVPALNGAVDAAPLARYWGPSPWSPIVGVVHSRGVDWYQHADGSFSTTQVVWRSDLGRTAAMTRVAHPGPAPAGAARQ